MNNDFILIKKYQVSGVYIIRNRARKRCFVSFSTNILASIIRSIEAIRELREDIENLELEVLETLDHPQFRVGHYIETYEQLGYTFYKRVKCSLLTSYITIERSGYAHVFVKNRRGYKRLVGVFDKIHLANKFVQDYYQEKYSKLTIADNELTRRFLSTGW